ncbi:ribosome maturation factor RimM [Rothia sp. P7181]|uniref:ribosome maturation factor RimM n=1 Tax=unclassified Rothia (in: high G+C Gram-positive bacteria) TaxID=2689056 RepID=UPI003AC5D8FF
MQILVARIGKPHGIRGEVTVELFTDSPQERFARGEQLSIENYQPETPVGAIAPEGVLTVAQSRWNKKILVVRFEEVTSRNQAETLRNTRLTFDASEVDSSEGYYEHDVVDLPVYLYHDIPEGELPEGEGIGTVTGLQTMPAQDLLLVRLHNGEETMIPFVEQIVPEVDIEEGFVLIDPPEGLLTLGSEESEDQ